MTLPHQDNELRKKLEDVTLYEEWHGEELLGEPLGNYNEAIDAILDIIISELPKRENIDKEIDEVINAYYTGRFEAIDDITAILTAAKEAK